MSRDTSQQARQDSKNQLKKMLPGLLRDIALPTGSYYLLKYFGASDVNALIAGGVVSGVIVLIELIMRRTVDFIAMFMMSLFLVGLGTLFLTGDPRFMLAKDSIGTGVAGLFFIGSALVNKPIIAEFARKTMPIQRQEGFDISMKRNLVLRRAFKNATIFSGTILLVEAIVRLPLIYSLPISTMVALSPFMGLVAMILTVIFSVKYIKGTLARNHLPTE